MEDYRPEIIPPEETFEIDLDALDLATLIHIRGLISMEAAGDAAQMQIELGAPHEAELIPIDDEEIRQYVLERERRIRNEDELESAQRLRRLATELDRRIALKEIDLGLDP